MPKKSDCTVFWCTEIHCDSYNSGEKCNNCEKFKCCGYCCLQNDIAMKSDSKSDELKCTSILDDITTIWGCEI